MPSLMSRIQLAALLNVTERTIDRWAKTGRLNPVRLGQRYTRFLAEDVQRLLRENRAVPTNTN